MTAASSMRRVVLLALTSILVAGCVSQADADDEAAVFADQLLAPRLERELERSGGDSAQRQVQAIHDWLTAPDADFVGSYSDTLWVAGAPQGSTIPVAVYALWDDTSFGNEKRWGRVCREYDVGATIVTRDVTCSKDTPREPSADAAGGEQQ